MGSDSLLAHQKNPENFILGIFYPRPKGLVWHQRASLVVWNRDFVAYGISRQAAFLRFPSVLIPCSSATRFHATLRVDSIHGLAVIEQMQRICSAFLRSSSRQRTPLPPLAVFQILIYRGLYGCKFSSNFALRRRGRRPRRPVYVEFNKALRLRVAEDVDPYEATLCKGRGTPHLCGSPLQTLTALHSPLCGAFER